MSDQYVVFVDDRVWRVGWVGAEQLRLLPVLIEHDAPPDARVTAAREQLMALGYQDQPILLATGSPWNLSARMSTEDLERGNRRRAMGFRLEEHLPMSSEDFVADYAPIGGGEALGVAAEYQTCEPIVKAFETAGIRVRHLCPAALLAAAHAVEQHPDADGVLIGPVSESPESAGRGYDLVEMHKAGPSQWWWFAEDTDAARARLVAWAGDDDRPTRLALLACGQAMREKLETLGRIVLLACDDLDADQAAALAGAKVLAGHASPWIDLRTDRLAAPGQFAVYRKPVLALVVALFLLLVGLSAAAHWRGRQYRALERRLIARQVEQFEKALPEQSVPSGGLIRRRLHSERESLAGLGAAATGNVTADQFRADSALVHLYRVLDGLPGDIRFRMLDLNIQPDLIRIDGQARSHVEAERIAVALRETGLYEVEPPRTQALRDRGVSFVFNARPREHDDQADARGGGR